MNDQEQSRERGSGKEWGGSTHRRWEALASLLLHTWAGTPTGLALTARVEIQAACSAPIKPPTGYWAV